MVALCRRLIPAEVRYDDEVRAGLAAVVERLGAAQTAEAPRPRMTTERRGGTTTRTLGVR